MGQCNAHVTALEQESAAAAAVQLQEVPLSELERIATVFGYSFAAPPRHLAGGYASCNFAVSLVPLDGSSSAPTQAVLKFSNTCIDLADIEHQLGWDLVFRQVEREGELVWV